MKEKIGSMLATAIGLILLGYSSYRSYDFVAMTLPPDRQVVAFFALAALDGGIIAWLLSYLYGSNGGWQRAIAGIMVLIDFLGAVTMFTLDTILNAGEAGLIGTMDPNTLQTAMLALSAVIAINIGATIMHHMLDPEIQRRMAEEEARAEIDAQAMRLIAQNSRQLAAEVAPQVAASWKDDLKTEYDHRLKKSRSKALPAQSEELPAQLPAQLNPTQRKRS